MSVGDGCSILGKFLEVCDKLFLIVTYSFGTIAVLLQLVPPFSMVFLMTTAAGSALWAADIEKKRAASERSGERVGHDYHDEA